jgi:hypothetical protein
MAVLAALVMTITGPLALYFGVLLLTEKSGEGLVIALVCAAITYGAWKVLDAN